MFSVDDILQNHFGELTDKPLRYSLLRYILHKILYEERFQSFTASYPQLTGQAFIEQAFIELDFSYQVSSKHRQRIPADGAVIITANHPIGSLDGLALLHLVGQIRSDVKIIANQMLSTLAPLQSLLLPVDNMAGRSARRQLAALHHHLEEQGAVIVFPAGEVSRLKHFRLRDSRWQRGIVKIADKSKAPILPICIHARNSAIFYCASMINKSLSGLLLVRELFYHQGDTIHFSIGQPIPHQSYSHPNIALETRAKLLKKHTYRIGAGKRGLFQTESAIAHPQSRALLVKAIASLEKLGETPDGQIIYLSEKNHPESLLAELGRLREYSFRTVGEGTGKHSDTDLYDAQYMHLILWHPNDQQIVGAYRLADSEHIIRTHGLNGLYSHSLFEYQHTNCDFLQQGIELGRSFIQPRYWGRRSLDYLWQGIGAFLASRPHYRYLFGPVSISASLPNQARDLLVYFYQQYFKADFMLVRSRNPYQLEQQIQQNLNLTFQGNNYREDFSRLKSTLANMGCAIPTLYKQYTELCEPGGVQFIDFNVDPNFKQCVDGLVLIDLTQLKAKKYQRYIGIHQSLGAK